MIMSPARKGTAANQSIGARKRKVVFHEIDFIQLSYTIGDNPCCASGAPVACSGDVQERVSFQVDYFEQHRPRRRYKQDLILSKSRRRSLLLKSGHALEEIDVASLEARRVKKQRISTLKEIGGLQQLTCRRQAHRELLLQRPATTA